METIQVCGIDVFIEESESYLQINDIAPSMMRQVREALAAKYPGFELWLCFHNSTPPDEEVSAIGAELLDDSIDMRISRQDFTACGTHANISLLKLEDFDAFAALHDQLIDPDFYWTSPLLRADWDIWLIHVLRDGDEIIGYALTMIPKTRDYGEVFAIEAPNSDLKKALLASACAGAFEAGKNQVVYMADTPEEQSWADGLGFRVTGYYKGYRVRL